MSTNNLRQIVLDTETTGINKKDYPHKNNAIIEIGAVEIINRKLTNNNFHVYLKTNIKISIESFKIHGISDEFLDDQPTFFDIKNEFLNYLKNDELIIHNAKFDIGFLNQELNKTDKKHPNINDTCKVTDSLSIARKIFPNKKNDLNSLCIRYNIDYSNRKLHSALTDAELLAKIFLLMTKKQKTLLLKNKKNNINIKQDNIKNVSLNNLMILKANNNEIIEHEKILSKIFQKHKKCIWYNKK